MMQAMGWSGKGLGKNEDGMAEHVKVSLKSNNLGIGADKKSIDNWMDNTFAFSSLLENLNKDNNEADEAGTTTTTTTTTIIKKKKKSKKSSKKGSKKSEEESSSSSSESEEEVVTTKTVETGSLRSSTTQRLA
ncbi:hypothetical protein BDR26DRAFT_273233 [Obelidium mucronatum]|nr:hypothetical protein BDR26DRAFT_273233 [Obelidium mucronatum]